MIINVDEKCKLMEDFQMNHLLNVKDKVAIVTGGSRGLGAQIVKDYVKLGADVMIVSRNKENCERLANEINSTNPLGRAVPFPADITKMSDINRLFQSCLDMFGRLDIL